MPPRYGRFEIQAEIGRGGFGQVYRAFDPVMNRVVAVKVLTATEDAGSFTRFKNEAAAAGNLDHPNIVTVFEFGEEVGKQGNTPFIVMEYLDGDDLQHVIRNNVPLSLYQKIRIMDQVADGLHCAHRKGFVHRDVKPANIMVLRDGGVKVMDFGIARLVRDTSTRLTQQGYLIGTVVYMAPELFTGAEPEADAICDIWAYGVILYELLAGKNPFQTGKAESEMYRIVNQDPPSLPPEICPPDLQAIVGRLLSRQRDRRYQSLEDTHYDLQPILDNLKKAEAERHLIKTQQLMAQKQWDGAEETARQGRTIDPQNRTFRIILERIQTEKQRQSLWPRIEEAIRRSTNLAEQRKIPEAITELEKALKLDSGNQTVLNRMQELRLLVLRLEEAAKLVSEARKEFGEKRLTAAFEHVSEARSLDPANQEAERLLENIQGEMQAREADREREAEIGRARGLMTIDDFDGAMKILKALDAKFPRRPDIRDLLAKIEQLIADRIRRAEFLRRLEHAKDSVRNSRFQEAVSELEQLAGSFPNEAEAANLLSYARQERKAEIRREDLKRITDSATAFNRDKKFPESVRILEEGLKKYPEDPELTRVLRITHALNSNFERERALQAGLKRCEALRQDGQWQQAIELISRLISDNPNNRELLDLEAAIQRDKSQAERAVAIRRAAEEVQGLLRAGNPDSAARVLDAAILSLGRERELTALSDQVREAQRAKRDREYIESELKHATSFEQSGDITMAIRIIDDALLRSPNAPELLKARERLGSDHSRAIRKRQIEEQAAAVEDLIKRKEWGKVQDELNEKTKLFQAEPVFQQLQRRKDEEISQLVAEGRRLLSAGQIPEAEQFCLANFKDYREVPEVGSLVQAIQDEKARRRKIEAEETQRTRTVAEALRAARDLEQKGDLSGALAGIQNGLRQYPREADLINTQRRLNELLVNAKRDQLFAGIRQALDRADWPRAMPLLDQARLEYPNDPELIPLQDRALDQRHKFLQGAAEAIRRKLAENNLDVAITLYEQNLARHQDQGIVREVAAEIAAKRSEDATEKQKRAFVSENLKQAAAQNDPSRAKAILQKALIQYPADPQLTAALNRAQSAIDRGERERALAARTAPIKRDLERGNWQDALKKLEDARTAFPENPPELTTLEQQARQLRDRELQGLLDKANGCRQVGNLSEAEKMLNKQLLPFAGDPKVAELAKALRDDANRLKEDRARETLIQTARAHTVARRFAESETAINELAVVRPNDPEVGRLRSALEAARQQEKYQRGRAEADRLLGQARYEAAINQLEELLIQFPGDAQLERDLKAAREKWERSKRKTAERDLPVQTPGPQVTPAQPKPAISRGLIYSAAGGGLAAVSALAVWLLWPNGIIVTPATLNFQNLAAQTVTVNGASNVAIPPSPPWLSVTRGDSASGKTEFVVRPLPDNLPSGQNTATTDLVFPQQNKVHVDLSVAPPTQSNNAPPIELNHAVLTFPYSPGGIPAQKLEAASSADFPDPKSNQDWVKFTRHNLGKGKAEFSVQVVPNGLAAGDHTADLTFSPDKKVQVKLTIPADQAPTQVFQVEPALLAFAGSGEQRVTVTSSSPVPEPSKSEHWLTATRAASRNGKTEFAVRASSSGLDAGKRIAYLTFSPPNLPRKTVTVELTVPQPTPPPGTQPPGSGGPSGGQPPQTQPPQTQPPVQTLELTTSALRFTYNRVKPPESQTVTATGLPDGAMPSKTAAWLTVTHGPGKNDFTVQVSTDGLKPGATSDELVFSGPNSQQKKVHVELVVFDPPDHNPPSGQLTWSGAALAKGAVLEIKKSIVIRGGGNVTKSLPSADLTVTTDQPTTILQSPAQGNNFVLRLRIESDNPIHELNIQWTPIKR